MVKLSTKFLKFNKLVCALLAGAVATPMYCVLSMDESNPGWKGIGEGRYYIEEGTEERATGLTEIDDGIYFFSGSGELQSGWQTIANETYYFGTDGKAVTGVQEINGIEYNFQADGVLMHGWSEDGTQYYDDKGYPVTNQWITDNGVDYYLDNDGIKVTGWQELEGKKYYFSGEGEKAEEKTEIDGKNYYFAEDGEYITGWVKIDGKKMYRSAKNGRILKNSAEEVDGVLRYFGKDGQMVKNAETEDYIIDKKGVATKIDHEKEAEEAAARKRAEEEAEAQRLWEEEQKAYQEQAKNTTTDGTASEKHQAIANAALAQVGVGQDCTMLATNSLATVGISFHGWPADYASLGSWTGNPVPGDLIIYQGHIAVYIGNGQAVHGGWLGYTTVVSSVTCTNALIGYIHVNL